jgi:hypothetical protein
VYAQNNPSGNATWETNFRPDGGRRALLSRAAMRQTRGCPPSVQAAAAPPRGRWSRARCVQHVARCRLHGRSRGWNAPAQGAQLRIQAVSDGPGKAARRVRERVLNRRAAQRSAAQFPARTLPSAVCACGSGDGAAATAAPISHPMRRSVPSTRASRSAQPDCRGCGCRSVAQLFYMNNVIHDIFYLRGFDEPAGNFQARSAALISPESNRACRSARTLPERSGRVPLLQLPVPLLQSSVPLLHLPVPLLQLSVPSSLRSMRFPAIGCVGRVTSSGGDRLALPRARTIACALWLAWPGLFRRSIGAGLCCARRRIT